MNSQATLVQELSLTLGLPTVCPVIQLLAKSLIRLNQALEAPLPDLTTEPSADTDSPKYDWRSSLHLQTALLRQTKEVLQLVKIWLALQGRKGQGSAGSAVPLKSAESAPVPMTAPGSSSNWASPEAASSATHSLLASHLPGGKHGASTNGLKKLAKQSQRR